jgi:hypothetical protein
MLFNFIVENWEKMFWGERLCYIMLSLQTAGTFWWLPPSSHLTQQMLLLFSLEHIDFKTNELGSQPTKTCLCSQYWRRVSTPVSHLPALEVKVKTYGISETRDWLRRKDIAPAYCGDAEWTWQMWNDLVHWYYVYSHVTLSLRDSSPNNS